MHEPISESCSNQSTSQRMLQTNTSTTNILTSLLSNTFQPTCSGSSNRISDLSRIETSLESITKSDKTFQHHGSQNDSTESSSLSPIERPHSSTTTNSNSPNTVNNSELQRKIDFNQFIKDRIQERILKRKVLKAKLLKLNNMRTVLERLLSNHHQNLYYVSFILCQYLFTNSYKFFFLQRWD